MTTHRPIRNTDTDLVDTALAAVATLVAAVTVALAVVLAGHGGAQHTDGTPTTWTSGNGDLVEVHP